MVKKKSLIVGHEGNEDGGGLHLYPPPSLPAVACAFCGDKRLGIPLSRFRRLRLPVRFTIKVWLGWYCRWCPDLSSGDLSMGSPRGRLRSRYRRAGVPGVEGIDVTSRGTREEGASRRRGNADDDSGVPSVGD